jgi:DNA-binding IclR family transcriptional regulator
MSEAILTKRHEDTPLQAVKTLSKALTLLDAVAEADHPPTVSELALKSGLARPTTHRLVQTLTHAGFLQQDHNGRLSIGFSVLPLAASLLDRNRLRLEALPHLQSLAQKIEERVNLGILHHNRILVLAGVEKPVLPTIYSRFGRTVPLHCCALGKAILSHLPTDEAEMLVSARPLVARTPNTITSVPLLMQELQAVRVRGYAIERGENSATSCCVGVPILDAYDRPTAAISVSARTIEPLIEQIGDILRTAEVISHVLRHNG